MEEAGLQWELETEVQINIHSRVHVDTVLSSLEEQRRKNFLCDITLIVENVSFRAHKALLAASSEYFSMMFADEGDVGQSIYVMEGMVAEIFGTLLQFIYTGNVHVSEKCLQQIVATAQILKVDDLVKAYADYQESQSYAKTLLDVADNELVEEMDSDLPKRKRGRPKKLLCVQDNRKMDVSPVAQTETDSDHGNSSEHIKATNVLNGSTFNEQELVSDYAAEVTCDLNPRPLEGQMFRKRHSKRRLQRSIMLRDYRLAEDNEEHEPLKHVLGRRKQPSTEAHCKDCGKVFKYKHFLAIHRRTHTGPILH
ncbi:zinc finger and BTB domain-containing protein 24 isoform X2 [Mixophyes fleayi]|uniref:zinc finger and BTB domain-containing protein 24 isoform X2 n=1 Tax=Mixophyes fleayi TaxID=3061075 RepID=UPI003F4D858C